ncbi:MAG: winged helix-turn-helix transcriptional regulator [Alphaproteobacteria bacterium]|nr:winged helix-turn-helix transcriptional regulator [Alphaproteobacteria bacterium]
MDDLSPHPEPTDPEDGTALTLERFLPYRLSVLSNTVSKGIAALYADRFGITIPEWRVLAVLGRFGSATSADICGRTAMDKVQVSRAIQRLTTSGMVNRQVDPADRRRATIAMTAKGRGVYREIVPLALSCEATLLENLNPAEREQLDALLSKLGAEARRLTKS